MFCVKFIKIILIAVLFGIASLSSVYAEKIITKESISGYVNIRQSPSGDSSSIGALRPGDQLDYVRSVTGWHEVSMLNGQSGYVSKRLTEVIPDPIDPTAGSTFAVHFLDVGTGDSAIIDIGDKEIIIDGGDSIKVLNEYVRKTEIIKDPIELVIVTHSDFDHWNGLRRLLGFDGTENNPYHVSEFWEPGYNRDCNDAGDSGRASYLQFIQDIRNTVPNNKFLRPLQNYHTPAADAGNVQQFTVSSIPGVTFTLLHSDSTPDGNDCAYIINNASIVMMIEIAGVRILFTGDENGKERNDSPTVDPKYVEGKLLTLADNHSGALKADILKVPHHGSETANTDAFINAVDPDYVVISASTKHHLPKDTVVDRYQNGQRVILKTDAHRENNVDHILCTNVNNKVDCNFADVFNN